MRINNLHDKLDDLGQKFLKKYENNASSKALTADINRIVNYLKQDHSDKQIHEISRDDIEGDIKDHILKQEDPLKSKNTVYKYIGTWANFLEFLKTDETYTHTHVFKEKLSDIKAFKEYIGKKYKLKDEETAEAYDIELVMKVLKEVDKRLISKLTNDQRYRLIQQSIFIQLTLLTGMPRRIIANFNIDKIKENIIELNGYRINLPYYTHKYINKYLEQRRVLNGHNVFFTTVEGNAITEKSNSVGDLFSSNSYLVKIFKSETDLLDESITCISNTALRYTAIKEMIKTKEDLFNILKLTGIYNSSIKELDEVYSQMYENENSLAISIKKNINILIMKLPYYDKLNGDENYFKL